MGSEDARLRGQRSKGTRSKGNPELVERYRWFHEGLEHYGVARGRYEAERERLTRLWGEPASQRDAAWAIWNQLIVEASQAGDFRLLAQVQFGFARAIREDKGDFLPMLTAARESQLHGWLRELPGARVRVLTAQEKSCARCRRMEGLTWDLEAAIAMHPLPVLDCEHGFCRCLYGYATCET